eukprot:TRINITY_DN11955_c0_g1_i1.p1 TRINITY_DN11955_c0_g1~~TRINITY_DN11955_c0_g1_i1.p1  ORF type:complete len:405 (+),score=112.22 TRINITY_DN11955_c0_g1_i1:119-1333(+)
MDENLMIVEYLSELSNLAQSPKYDNRRLIINLSQMKGEKINAIKSALNNIIELIDKNENFFTNNNNINNNYLTQPIEKIEHQLNQYSHNTMVPPNNNYINNNNGYNIQEYHQNQVISSNKKINHQININYNYSNPHPQSITHHPMQHYQYGPVHMQPYGINHPQSTQHKLPPLNHLIRMRPTLPSVSDLSFNLEKDYFREEKYREVLTCLDILAENIDDLIDKFLLIPNQNLSPFNNVLTKEDKHSAIKIEVTQYYKNISNHLFYASIEYLKLGFYFSFLKSEAYKSNINYVKYIRDKTGWDKGTDTILYYIKFYAIFCKIPCIIFLIGNFNYTSSFFFKKNGTSLIEIAEYNGKNVKYLNTKVIPDILSIALPPSDTPFKDAYKEKKKRKATAVSNKKIKKIK